jgi:phosphate:Na+ symporter
VPELHITPEMTCALLYGLGLFLLGLFFIPIVNFFKRLSAGTIKKRNDSSDFHLKSIDNRILNTPSLALGQARAEIRRMGGISLKCLDETILFLNDPNARRVSELEKKEEMLDRLQKEIMDFLVALSLKPISEEIASQLASLVHMVTAIERIGDQCESIWQLKVRTLKHKISFSEIASRELTDISSHARNFLSFVVEYIDQDKKDESKVLVIKMDATISDLESDLRHNHVKRLSTGECAVLPGLIFIDILHDFKMVGEHTFNLYESFKGDN